MRFRTDCAFSFWRTGRLEVVAPDLVREGEREEWIRDTTDYCWSDCPEQAVGLARASRPNLDLVVETTEMIDGHPWTTWRVYSRDKSRPAPSAWLRDRTDVMDWMGCDEEGWRALHEFVGSSVI